MANSTTKLNVSTRPGVLVRTTDATPTAAVTFATSASKAYWFEVKVTAVYSDTSKAAAYWLTGLFRTAADGTLTQVGSTQSIMTAIEDTGSMDCTIAASGTNIAVTITGVAATNIQWRVDATIESDYYLLVN